MGIFQCLSWPLIGLSFDSLDFDVLGGATARPVGSRMAPASTVARPGMGSRIAMNDRTNMNQAASAVSLTSEAAPKEADPEIQNRLEFIETYIKSQMLQQQVPFQF